MRGYEKYIRDVLSGKIVTCKYVKQAVERFEAFLAREDIYFDRECVDAFIDFVGQMKHWVGPAAGKNFELLPWQQFFFACILGLKWKETRLRVCRETYLQLARKQGKSSIIAA